MSFIFIETNEIVCYILVSILSRCQWRGVYYIALRKITRINTLIMLINTLITMIFDRRCRNNDAEIGDDDDFGCQSTESDKVYLKIIYVHEQSASDDDVILRDVSEGF